MNHNYEEEASFDAILAAIAVLRKRLERIEKKLDEYLRDEADDGAGSNEGDGGEAMSN